MYKIILIIILQISFANLFAQKGPNGKSNVTAVRTINWKLLSTQSKNKVVQQKYEIETPENAGGKKEEQEEQEQNRKETEIIEQSISAPAANKNIVKRAPAGILDAVNCKAFQGLNEVLVGSSPPDVSMATGMDHLVMAINTGIIITNKNTGYIDTIANSTFWGGLGFSDLFDPKILYDQASNRWIMTIVAQRTSAASAICLAVSQTFDPTGNWTVFSTDADPANIYWFDYPSIGFSNDKIVITGNMFTFTGTSASFVRTYIYNKIDLYNGIIAAAINYFDDASYFTLVPAIAYDNVSNVYCAAQKNGSVGQLYRNTISGSAAAPTMSGLSTIDYPYAWASGAGDILPQAGTAIKINGGDTRLLSYILRGNVGYIAFTGTYPSGSPSSSGATFASFNNTTLAVIDLAAFYDPAGTWMTAFPNLTVNANGVILVSCSYFSTTTYGASAVGIWHPGDGAYSNAVVYATKFGEDIYNRPFGGRNRWGDYSGICVDPSDDKTIWMAGEYATPRDPGPGASRWGTWFSKYCADCPANLTLSGTMTSNTLKKSEVTNTITSTAILNSGSYIKYDAGNAIILSPGFRATIGSVLKAFIEGCGGADF
jgi:hypothetical protein